MASRVTIDEVLKQISDEQWCESDDDLPDGEEDWSLEAFFQKEDPRALDKAGAGRDDDDEETCETTPPLPLQEPTTPTPLDHSVDSIHIIPHCKSLLPPPHYSIAQWTAP